MSRHWRIVEQLEKTPSPPANIVDVHVLMLSPSDVETLPPSSGAECPLCSKVFSSCNSLREHMSEHSQKKLLSKPVEEAAGLMEALAIVDGGYNVMLSPSVKRKRSKRGPPVVNFGEMDAAATLLLLSESSKKIPAYEDCCAEDMDSSLLHVSKDLNQNAFDHLLIRSTEFKKTKGHKSSTYDDCYGKCEKDDNLNPNVPKDNSPISNVPKNSAYQDCCGRYDNENILFCNVSKMESNVIRNVSDKDNTLIPNVLKDSTFILNIPDNSAYEDCYGQYEKDNILFPSDPKKDSNVICTVPEKENTLIPSVPKEVELIVLDHVLAGDSELRKPRTDSVEIKCGDLSAAMKVKRYQCNTCRKSFGSGQALGGHMRCHHPNCNHRRQGFADRPESVVMDEQKQKTELDSKLLDVRLPALTDRHYIFSGLQFEPEPWPVASRVH
ncbi:hypothetical protein QYE76_001342 [Lolium multiflorum]|uniref:C2H2-type domain-containing protein n=1 Tax=Lolium multiflorum TaxID=4521 RepID=A0AAD8RMQ5_LOLMU|nr:hypothetical protein QYE76_001342 [Lolium multiflorum]